MTIIKNFRIILTKSQAVFLPEQSVEGIVQFNIVEKFETTGVFLEVTGLSYVVVEEKHGKSRNGVVSQHTSLERYCHTKIDLATKGGAAFPLTTGTYQYPFATQLPDELPTSFEGENGCTRYYLRAYILRESQGQLEFLLPFTIISVFNLNESPYAMRSEEAEDVQMVSCCTSGSVKTKLKLSKIGYVPGEIIQLDGECDNQSQNALKTVFLDLIMNVTLKATNKEHSVQRSVKTWHLHEIQGNTTLSLDNIQLVVPPLPPSGSRFCNNIDVHYCLQLTAKVSSGVCCKVSVGLIIGNLPLELGNSQFAEQEDTDDIGSIEAQLPENLRSLVRKTSCVPAFRNSGIFSVTLDHHFPLSDEHVNNHHVPVPLQCPGIQWHPSYLCFVEKTKK
ncbi:arrestin domain-containing protein 17-like [Saccostrea echinata]|uniref:arrestin domain-containing protein 17-like n=1 Tax=Saccostrea echinata TaxID=191078 RepID=UPI002A83D155|nr:arrestin domain-containing protein 17-like [Saccostrea echinata]